MLFQPQGVGWLEVISGPMFSGKTEELIRRLRHALFAGLPVQAFKPVIDDRYEKFAIASHDGRKLEAVAVRNVDELRGRIRTDTRVIGIDEVQFFSDEILDLCRTLADNGTRVIVAGLDQDYHGRPFAPMPELLAEAESVTKSLSICVRCGNPALRSHRLSQDRSEASAAEHGNPVDVGSVGAYVPLCRLCFATARDEVDLKASQGALPLLNAREVRGRADE